MHQGLKAISLVLLAALLVAVGHGLHAANTFAEADQYEVVVQKLKPFLSAGSRINVVEDFSKNENMLHSRGAFFPVLLFHEREFRLDTVLRISARSNALSAGELNKPVAQKILFRHQDDSNIYMLLVRGK